MPQYTISVCTPTPSNVCTRTDIARSSSKSKVQTKRILLCTGLAYSISGGDVDEIQVHDPCDVNNGEDRASTRLCLCKVSYHFIDVSLRSGLNIFNFEGGR